MHYETREVLAMRQDTLEPPRLSLDRGAMLTALVEGGYGYCATSDVSRAGLQKALDRAKAEGRDESLREDIAMRKAVDLMVESAKPITVEQAKARDKLWTPGKEGEAAAKGLLGVGTVAPDWSLRDPPGRVHSSKAYRGKVVLLYFWQHV